MKKLYIITSLILTVSLLYGCTGEFPDIDESHESTSEIVTNESEDDSNDQTESLEKDEISNEESSEIQETSEESDSEDTSETESETHEPTFDDCGKLEEKLNELFEASYNNKIDIVASKFYFDPTVNWNYNLDITIENGNIFIAEDRNYYISSYTENLELTLPVYPGFENEKKLLNKLNDRDCYILKTDDDRKHYGEELALYYFEDNFLCCQILLQLGTLHTHF